MNQTRWSWISHLTKIAHPVFEALANDELRRLMPVEHSQDKPDRHLFTHLEALGRSLAGIAPWLEIQSGITPEEDKARKELLGLVKKSIDNATDANAADFMNFDKGSQPLVDASFLALGLLRSWNSLWLALDSSVQESVIMRMKSTRRIKPPFNNWILFSAIVEAFLCRAGKNWDPMRVDFALQQHEQWYKGDGVYGDGPVFHWDYYNSFVIQPMLLELVHAVPEFDALWPGFREKIIARARRFAVVQERFISPEGTVPAIGRSLAYRFGIFHHLAAMVLKHEMPKGTSLPGIRCAMTAVMKRLHNAEGTFDDQGWLQIGFCGHQPSIGEGYISTGSLYLTLCGFLPLGLPEDDPFWSEPDANWTSRRVWSGKDDRCDHAIQV